MLRIYNFSSFNYNFSFFMFKDVNKKGKRKNLKHAAEEIGFPGRPKNAVFLFLNFENKIGLPGLIATPLKELASLKFLIIPGTKSNLPAETAPDVMIIFVLDFKCLFISFIKTFWSLSLKIFWVLKIIGKLLISELK